MCGFVGYIDTSPVTQKQQAVKAMSDLIRHRGPDSEGYFVDEAIAMGFRRLSIIDLVGGNQPIFNEDGNLAITFNGEIYNYRELKAELADLGHVFSTTSDTEVVVHAYEQFGEGVLDKLRGMFSFVIWDKNKRELFGARDFFGIKPFYYADFGDTFFFGSEIKAFLAHPGFQKELNPEALKVYLSFQYSALEETFFKGVYRLRPGHCLKYSSGKLTVRKYFDVRYQPGSAGFEEYADLLEKTLADSVSYHQISDVEVGAFLSGGVDSSFIVSSARPDKTFSVGFGNDGFDESLLAGELSGLLGIGNTRKLISGDEFFDALPDVQYHTDEPHANLSAVPLYFLARLAAEKVKVVLSGEGSDEMFAGYIPFERPPLEYAYSKLPFALRRAMWGAVRPLPNFKGKNLLERKGTRPEDYYIGQAFMMGDEEANSLLRPQYRSGRSFRDVTAPYYAEVAGESDEVKKLYLDMHLWLPNDILLKADKMTMASSLELRVPFLDKEVWNLARRIPMKYKVQGRQTKYIFRRVANRIIPSEWANRKKLGFPVPFSIWAREEKYYKLIRFTFEQDFAAEFFESDRILHLLDDHYSGKANNGRKIYTVYAFLVWYKRYFIDI